MHVEAGEHIAVRGQPCDSMFIVLNGRLRARTFSSTTLSDVSGKSTMSECIEYGRGDTIGELEALAEGHWTHDIFASRHCEVARVPMTLLHVLMAVYPKAGIYFAKVVAKMQSRKGLNVYKSLNATESFLPSYGLSLATIAVVPLTQDVDVSDFCLSFTKSLHCIAPTKLLAKDETITRIGKGLLMHPSALLKIKMTRFLGDLEENNRLVVYQADSKFTWWTKLAIQQADCVLLVVESRNAPYLSLVEGCLAWAHSVKSIRIELVVVQSSAAPKPGKHASDEVNDWSENRSWISNHHLVRMPFEEHMQDFSRMCRRVTGQSIGLVLGGGGARGLAHLGVIRALNEAGLSVDMVGETSQGAFVGALFAKVSSLKIREELPKSKLFLHFMPLTNHVIKDPDNFELLEKTLREMAANMSSMKEKLLE